MALTDEQKKHYAIVALISIGTIALIVYLMRSSSGASSSLVPTAPDGSQPPTYPNAEPIQLGDINIGGSPNNITYNSSPQIPTLQVAPTPDSNACCGGCIPVGQLSTVNTIPQSVLDDASDNLDSYNSKVGNTNFGAIAPLDSYGL